MPLRYVRSKLSTDNILNVAVVTTAITRELADLTQFPPAKAAASLLLMILQTIQGVQMNRNDCYRLARRCLSLLMDMRDQMLGRWEDAPRTLLQNFKKMERTLESIHQYMLGETQHKWHNRLLRKSTIEEAIADFNAELDDAARSFQISTLISIHYAVGDSRTKDPGLVVLSSDHQSPPLYIEQVNVVAEPQDIVSSPISAESIGSYIQVDETSSICTIESYRTESFEILPDAPATLSPTIADAVPAAVSNSEVSDTDAEGLDHRGFRRYHQSEVTIKGRSSVKKGWWSGITKAQVDGRDVVLKPYDGPRQEVTKKWIRDIKILQNVYHPNLPQMVGYSENEVPTPFILLANVQTRLPQALVLDTIQNASLTSCVQLLLRFYRDTLDAALYMKRQLNLSNSKVQDYVESASYRIDSEQTLIMGLPPPDIDNWISWRNYGLLYSVRQIYGKLLPNGGYARRPQDPNDKENSLVMQRKINHLAVLARALLPDDGDTDAVIMRLNKFLGDEEEEEGSATLREIRLASIDANIHSHTWNQNLVPAYRYSVGDLGYVPSGADFNSFVTICNVIADGTASFEVTQHASAELGSWSTNGPGRSRQELYPFPLPNDVHGWAITVPPGSRQDLQVVHTTTIKSPDAAWKFLITHGKRLSQTYGVDAEELILVTRVGTDHQFRVHDFRVPPLQPMLHARPGPQFPVPGQPAFGPPFNHRSPSLGFQGQFGGHHHPQYMHPHGFPGQSLAPHIFYLFSSPKKEHEPYWSETPVYPPPPGSQGISGRAKAWCSTAETLGFMNYVQLHHEDFAS